MSSEFSLIKEMYKNNKIYFFITAIIFISMSFMQIGIAWFLQETIDYAIHIQNVQGIKHLVFIFSILMIISIFIYIIMYYVKPEFIKRAMVQYKSSVFSELSKKTINAFSKDSTSNYISALTNDLSVIEANYIANVFSLIQMIVSAILALLAMILYSPLLTIIVFALVILPVIVSMMTANKIAIHEKKVSTYNALFTENIKDTVSGFPIIKTFKAEDVFVERFDQFNDRVENEKLKRNRVEILVRGIGDVAGLISQIGIFLAGAYLSITGDVITIGMVMAFTQLINYVLKPISELPEMMGKRKASKALINKIEDTLSNEIIEKEERFVSELKTAITFDHVSYAHEKDEDVLKNISLEIKKGGNYAVVGPSGSGKSTLLSLLIDQEKDYRGDIFFDQENIKYISTDSLFQLISHIDQNVYLFNGTIMENITLFKKFDEEWLQRAITFSGLEQLLKQKGFDYEVGEGGRNLSGGERQRISIARSLLQDNRVLLIDEATSSLDNITAQFITNSIANLEGYTRITVTHRLLGNELKKYDEIIVLKDGRIIEKGSFDELIAKKEFFYNLYRLNQYS